MAFTITKTTLKSALADKTKSRKKVLVNKTSLVAMAASAPDNLLADMQLERRPIAELKGLPRRTRKSEKEQIERVARSLKTLKQCAPIVINDALQIINGQIVAQALESLGEKHVLCVRVDHLSEHQCEMVHVALNCIGERGEWDLEALGPLLVDLGELGFELEATGFGLPELDIIMSPAADMAAPAEVEENLEPPLTPMSLEGDLWRLGDHLLLCGDATDAASYSAVLGKRVADAVFTDCPWNIPIAGFVSGLGKTKHQDFKMGVGEMSEEAFAAFSNAFHGHCAERLKDGGVFFSCIDWRSVDVIMTGGKDAGLRHINIAVWNKGSGGMGAPYRSAHELVVVFCKGPKLAVNNVELGKHGRDRTNVWTYPGANRLGSSASKALAHHPTPKPVEMVEDALKDVTKRGDLVLDPFLGSGTTLLAAERCGRKACGIELDPAYVDVAIRRWEALSGKAAIHVESGHTFEELAAKRIAGPAKAAV